jgi:hypothetical protein
MQGQKCQDIHFLNTGPVVKSQSMVSVYFKAAWTVAYTS